MDIRGIATKIRFQENQYLEHAQRTRPAMKTKSFLSFKVLIMFRFFWENIDLCATGHMSYNSS